MIAEILAVLTSMAEWFTGDVLVQTLERRSPSNEEGEALLSGENIQENPLEEFTSFDPQDAIFQQFDAPENLDEPNPKAWKQNLPTFKKSFWDCLKTVLLIQTVAGSLVGFLAVVIVFFDFSTVEWCYSENRKWNKIPMDVQRLRVSAQVVEGFIIEMWNFCTIIFIFPFSLIKYLNLLALNLLASFIDVTYRLYFQMYGIYRISWMSFPLNALFCLVIIINNFLIARHFSLHSVKKFFSIFFILSAQFIFGIALAFFLVYKLFPFYVKQEGHQRLWIAAFTPLASAIPKGIARLGAQKLKGMIHPGTAHVLVVVIYGSSAVVFRVFQAELTSLGLFIALGIAHAIIDLLERISITMRDQIWECFYRLVRRQRSRQPKYRSPRSRRFIADVSIQIMMQESTALITALGFNNVYQFMYNLSKPSFSHELISDFFIRAGIGLSIDLVFNTISLLIQTRVMNVAVNRVWKKKWRHHLLVNALLVCISVLYFSGHLFEVVRRKYELTKYPSVGLYSNCSFPSFL